MTKKQRYLAFIKYFSKNNPNAKTELNYRTPFELLIAVMLSAQCTDVRINQVTTALFQKFPTPDILAKADFETVFPYIRSVSYPNNKTKYIIKTAQILVEEYQQKVPDSVELLMKLPGIGRKTANVITSVLYNQPNMAVDTHVFRVSKRLGLVSSSATTPLATEKELTAYLPIKYVHIAHHWLILHGRYVCIARKPKCESCEISFFCQYFEKKNSTLSSKKI